MKIMHLSDLHLGKKLNGFSMVEEQKYIHNQILQIAQREKVEAVIIAGDIFDKANPSASAVQLFDDFLTSWAELNLPIFLISGNHDSAKRISFGARLFKSNNVYISPVYSGKIVPISLQDIWGSINFYLLPFIKPATVRTFFPEEEINSYNETVKIALKDLKIDKSQRNILVAHQFVTGAKCCDSEEIIVGGVDNIDVDLFGDFDYVALGHIHTPQIVKKDTVRYCGTPLKYSFSEANQQKSVTIIDFKAKNQMEITLHELTPRRDLRKLKGTYSELTLKENYLNTNTDDYVAITLTDELEIPEAISKLRVIYPNIMQLDYDNARTRSNNQLKIDDADVNQKKMPLELFDEFYQLQNNQKLNQNQRQLLKQLIGDIWEGE